MRFASDDQRRAVMARMSQAKTGILSAVKRVKKKVPSKSTILEKAEVASMLLPLTVVGGAMMFGRHVDPKKMIHVSKVATSMYPDALSRVSVSHRAARSMSKNYFMTYSDITPTNKYSKPIRKVIGGINRLLGKGTISTRHHREGKVIISGGSGPAILAHELGHGTMLGRDKLARFRRSMGALQNLNPTIPKLGIPVSVGIASLLDNKRQEVGKSYSKTRKAMAAGALGLTAVAAAPILLEEGIASTKAMKILHRAGTSKARMLGSAGLLGAAYASYVGAFGFPTLRYAQKARKEFRSKA